MNSSPALDVVAVRQPRQMEDFLRLPWRLYAADPLWVPPLLEPQRRFLDPHHGPFFQNGVAEYFLAYQHGQPVARLSAHINHLYNRHHDPRAGFFGFYESIPDLDVSAALFAAAAAYLRSRGFSRLLGPLNFSVYDEMGLLVEGFDSMPAVFQTHNPPYYHDFLQALGFRRAMDWLAFRFIDERAVDIWRIENRLHDYLRGHSLTFVPFRWRDYSRWAAEVYELFNEAWEGNWGHVPLSRSQFFQFFNDLKPLIRPELVRLIVHREQLVAFCIIVPDLNPLVRKLNGRFNLWDKLRLYYAARYAPLRKVRALVLGVRKHYRHLQLQHAMIALLALYLWRHTPCECVDISLVPANLRPWVKTLKSFGAQHYKTFRVFTKDI